SMINSCPHPGCLATGRTGRTRLPEGIAAADFDDNGTYDVINVNDGGANVTVAVNAGSTSLMRGDGNLDARISAADIVAVMATVAVANQRAVEDAVRAGQAATLALDADGDGLLTTTDAVGVVARLFR